MKAVFLLILILLNITISFSSFAQTKRGGGGVPNDEITNIRVEKINEKVKKFLIKIAKRFRTCEVESKEFKDLVDLRLLISFKKEFADESIFEKKTGVGCEKYQPNITITDCLITKSIQDEIRSIIDDEFFFFYLKKYTNLNDDEKESLRSFYKELSILDLKTKDEEDRK